MQLNEFIKEKRNAAGLTQPELAEKAGVGLRFIRDLEQGKQTLRLDKVNQLVQLFGYQVGPIEMKRADGAETTSASDKTNAKVIRKKKSHEKG